MESNDIIIKPVDPIKKLLEYQIPHVYQLIDCLKKTNVVLDASDTGTGKTYCSIVLCHILNLKPFILCPKSVINNWLNVANEIGVEILGIANYEKIKGCKYYDSKFKLATCPYITKFKPKNLGKIHEETKPDGTIKVKIKTKKLTNEEKEEKKEKEKFIVTFPENTIIIIDEAHRCKNHKSTNSKLLIGMKESGKKLLLLSATITDKIDCFKPFGIVFGFYNDIKKYKLWVNHHLDKKRIEIQKLKERGKEKGIEFTDEQLVLKLLHSVIFPKCGSRISIKQLGNKFPSNQVVARCYYSDDHDEVNNLYQMINKALENLKFKETQSCALGQIMRCRMRIEMIKVPIILDELDTALENGYSCVIFVNFKDTMFYLTHHISDECCLIHGDQTLDERQYNIEQFQNNKVRIIICITQAGGVGISLHDLHGVPRMSIISPSWSGSDVVQALGRIHRSGAKSPSIQRIVYVAKSYEEEICKNLSGKLTVLSSINDGDLLGPQIPTEKLKEDGLLDKINSHIVVNNSLDETEITNQQKPQKKKYVTFENDDVPDISRENSKINMDINKNPFSKLDNKYRTKGIKK